MGHGGEFWQNMVHWRRKWQTTSSFLLGNPMSSMKRQKDMTLNVPCPRLGRVQYATERDQRNSSRRNKEAEPKQKQCPVVDMCGDECKVWYCKEQYCIGTWNVRPMNQGKLDVVKEANSGSWWWTGRPGMLQFMGSQRVGHDWMVELNWTEQAS